MTFDEAIRGTTAPPEILETLALIDVPYYGFDNLSHEGQIVVAKDVSDEVKEIFSLLTHQQFPIEKVIPLTMYDWDDERSMQDNNTAAFNYRVILGTKTISFHAYGRAIDINPKINPYIGVDRSNVQPRGAVYTRGAKGTIVDHDVVVQTFLKFGWQWGGHWMNERGYVDYQHFQKPAIDISETK